MKPTFAPEPVPAYSGLLDDFSLTFEDYCIGDVDSLNRRLIYAVLLGDPLLVNDGYVIMNPALRSAVVDAKRSPFCSLVESGFVKVLTRNRADLTTLADEMAEDAVGKTRGLVTSDWYRKKYRPALVALMHRLQRNPEPRSFRPWPERKKVDVSKLFEKAAENAYNAMLAREVFSNDEMRRFYDQFQSAEQHRRTEWEAASDQLKKDAKLSDDLGLHLMQAASEAYHYAWGCALAQQGESVRVQTRAPRYLDFDVEMAADHLSGSAEDHEVTVDVPLFDAVYKKASSNWNRLVEASSDDEFLQHKQSFRDKVGEYYGATSRERREALSEAATSYTKFLKRYFRSRRMFDLKYGLAGAGVGAGVGLLAGPLGVPAGAGIGFGVAAGGSVLDYLGARDFILKYAPVGGSNWLDVSPKAPGSSATSSFLVDPDVAARFRDVAMRNG